MVLPSPAIRLELAQQLLAAYDLQPVTLTFIQHSENITFRVDTTQGIYLLRLHSAVTPAFGDHGANPAVVRSELLWLEALLREGLPVPRPKRTKTGDYVAQAGGVNATLLEWQEGELLTREMESEDTAAQIGVLVGKMHAQSSQWKLPYGFTRPRRDATYFQNALQMLLPAVEDGRIGYQDYKTLQASIERLSTDISGLRKRSRKLEGLLHGDLHRGNFLFHEGQIRMIDFSMCAFGQFTYDLGTCLSNVRMAFHPIFLDFYTQFFSLPADYESLIEGFFIGSYVVTFSLWIADVNSQEILAQRVPYIAREYASRFNRDERFWFPRTG
jgi:Ser/Thr protein kinase RdoA (MazF antagonist)